MSQRLRVTTIQFRLKGWKWRLAAFIDKVWKRSCWSLLADWAGDWDDYTRLRDCGQGTSCSSDFTILGTCYCGKLRDASRFPAPDEGGAEK